MYDSSASAIKAQTLLSEVVGRYVALKRRGKEHWGLCPFHDERTPSFAVHDGKGVYYCQGCGASGDVFDFIQYVEKTDFTGAKNFLSNASNKLYRTPGAEKMPLESAEPALGKNRDKALEIWRESIPAAGTLAEVYLLSRGITIPPPPTLRFHPALRHYRTGLDLPTMVAAVSDNQHKVVAIQRIYLKVDGLGKANIDPAKMCLGSIKGSSVRLSPLSDTLILTEGLEDGLTILQEKPDFTVWSALGAQNLGSQTIPPEIKHLIIGADNDPAGQEAAKCAAAHYTRQGFNVTITTPKNGKDFNENLQKRTAA